MLGADIVSQSSLLARAWGRLLAMLRGVSGGGAPLCDTCRYDYGEVCTRPERPNAMKCPDYKRR